MKKNRKILIPLFSGLTVSTMVVTPLLVSCGNKDQPTPTPTPDPEQSISIGGIPQTIQIESGVADHTVTPISVNYSNDGIITNVIAEATAQITFTIDGAAAEGFSIDNNGRIAWVANIRPEYKDKDVAIQASYTNEAGKVFNASSTFKIDLVNAVVVPASLTWANISGSVAGTAGQEGAKTDEQAHLWFTPEYIQVPGGSVTTGQDVIKDSKATIEFFNNEVKVDYFKFDEQGHIAWTDQVPTLENANIDIKATYKYTKDDVEETITTDPIHFVANFIKTELPESISIPIIETEYTITNYGTGIDYNHPITVNYYPMHWSTEKPDPHDVTRFSKLTILEKKPNGQYEPLSSFNFGIDYVNMSVPNVASANGFYIWWEGIRDNQSFDWKIRAEYKGLTFDSIPFKIRFALAQYYVDLPRVIQGSAGEATPRGPHIQIYDTVQNKDVTGSLLNNVVFYQNDKKITGVYSILKNTELVPTEYEIIWNKNIQPDCGCLHLFVKKNNQELYVGSVPFYFNTLSLHFNDFLNNKGIVGIVDKKGVSEEQISVYFNGENVTDKCTFKFFLDGNEIKNVFNVELNGDKYHVTWNDQIFYVNNDYSRLYINATYRHTNGSVYQFTEQCRIKVLWS